MFKVATCDVKGNSQNAGELVAICDRIRAPNFRLLISDLCLPRRSWAKAGPPWLAVGRGSDRRRLTSDLAGLPRSSPATAGRRRVSMGNLSANVPCFSASKRDDQCDGEAKSS